MMNLYEILGGRDLTDTNYTNWDSSANASIYTEEPKCMQLLSGTASNGTWMPRNCDDVMMNRALCQLK